MGYHPDDDAELTNEQLPYAQFYYHLSLDLERNKGKVYTILRRWQCIWILSRWRWCSTTNCYGCFCNIRQAILRYGDKYEQPFKPFSGYTSKIKSSDFMIKNEVSDQSGQYSQKSVRHISPKQAKQLQDKTKANERSASASLGTGC